MYVNASRVDLNQLPDSEASDLCLHFKLVFFVCVDVLWLSQPRGSCRAQSVYLTTLLLGKPSPLSGQA